MRTLLYFTLSLLILLCFADLEVEEAFITFCNENRDLCRFNSKDESRERYEVFSENYNLVKHENSLNRGYTLRLNKFALLTREEFKRKVLMTKRKPLEFPTEKIYYPPRNTSIPTSYNWTSMGVVTEVKGDTKKKVDENNEL